MRIRGLAIEAVLVAASATACSPFSVTPSSADGGTDASPGADGGDAGPGVDAAAMSGYAATVLADAPILYYRLGESAGSTVARDLSAAPRNASVIGGTTPGVQGAIVNDPDTAYRFDGKTGAVMLANGPTFAGFVPYSVEAWVRPTSFVAGRVIAACQAVPAGGWAMFFMANAIPHFERQTATGTDGIMGPAVTTAGFTHLVGTFDGTTQRLYVDGGLSEAQPSTMMNAGPVGVPFVIGANGVSAQINFFEGDIDEVAIYDHALAAERVTAHFRMGRGLGP